MPYNKERTAATYAKEILRVVSGSELAENAVVDGTLVPLNGDSRRILETGTVMVWSGAVGTSKVKPAPSANDPALTASMVAGIVMHTTEFWPDTPEANKDDAPIALFTKNCHFAKDKLINYSNNAAVIETAMEGGGNGRCANCTFE